MKDESLIHHAIMTTKRRGEVRRADEAERKGALERKPSENAHSNSKPNISSLKSERRTKQLGKTEAKVRDIK